MQKKDYMFFDIECCDGKHICSFGYVICDQNFNLLDKKDILINPEKPFVLGPPGCVARVNLAHKAHEFKNQPKFTFVYPEIKNLIGKQWRMLLGHSIRNDVRFLNQACMKENIEPFNIRTFDTQQYYKDLKRDRNPMSLERIIAELGIHADGLIPHKSCDDAHLAMLVMKEICAQYKKTLDDCLIEQGVLVLKGGQNKKRLRLLCDDTQAEKHLANGVEDVGCRHRTD